MFIEGKFIKLTLFYSFIQRGWYQQGLSSSNIGVTMCRKRWEASQVPLGSTSFMGLDSFILLVQRKSLLNTHYTIRICSQHIGYNRMRYISICKQFQVYWERHTNKHGMPTHCVFQPGLGGQGRLPGTDTQAAIPRTAEVGKRQ